MVLDSLDPGQTPASEPCLPSRQRIEQVVREHFSGVWRLVRRYGLNAPDADDVAQRTMLIATQHIDEIAIGSERAYLYRTALFLTSKLHRDRSRHPQEPWPDREETTDHHPDPEALLEQRRARARLDGILASLPEELRVVFLLYELESFSQSEISTMLGVPQGTVSSRLRRARECFAERMMRGEPLRPPRARGAMR